LQETGGACGLCVASNQIYTIAPQIAVDCRMHALQRLAALQRSRSTCSCTCCAIAYLAGATLAIPPKKIIFRNNDIQTHNYGNINDKKVEAVRSWPISTNVKEVRGFFGFANFYCRFIEGFKRLATLFIKLTKKDKAFE
jgi:hypothetical protein